MEELNILLDGGSRQLYVLVNKLSPPPGVRVPGTLWIGSWVGPRVCLSGGSGGSGEKFLSCLDRNLVF
jgi:hypothetical protein